MHKLNKITSSTELQQQCVIMVSICHLQQNTVSAVVGSSLSTSKFTVSP